MRTSAITGLFQNLNQMTALDSVDWYFANQFAERWKLSVADALLDLNFVNETVLAKALAKTQNLNYLPGNELACDFSEIDLETFSDLVRVGAAPLVGDKLAICNPFDDHRGHLGNHLCSREMVLTERSSLFDALRKQGLLEWSRRDMEG